MQIDTNTTPADQTQIATFLDYLQQPNFLEGELGDMLQTCADEDVFESDQIDDLFDSINAGDTWGDQRYRIEMFCQFLQYAAKTFREILDEAPEEAISLSHAKARAKALQDARTFKEAAMQAVKDQFYSDVEVADAA